MDVAKRAQSTISANSPTYVPHLRNSTAVANTTLEKAAHSLRMRTSLALSVAYKRGSDIYIGVAKIYYMSEFNHFG